MILLPEEGQISLVPPRSTLPLHLLSQGTQSVMTQLLALAREKQLRAPKLVPEAVEIVVHPPRLQD